MDDDIQQKQQWLKGHEGTLKMNIYIQTFPEKNIESITYKQ